MENKPLYERKNYDDVFNRVVIIGLLSLMNEKLSYNQIWENNVVETVKVPVMYDFGSSDERFAQDNYTFFGRSCFGNNMIDGKFDMLPRGAIRYTGCNIDSANITNRFVKGNYTKNDNGTLTSYTAFLYSIPLTFNFDCEFWADNIDTAFKIEQAVRDTFYKVKTYNVLYRGMKLNCRAGFPESQTLTKTTSYSFDADRQIKLNFNIAVEAYQPCFDDSMSVESGNVIEYFGIDFSVYSDGMTPRDKKVSIKIDPFDNTRTYFSGQPIEISWDASSNVSDTCTVFISYVDEKGKETVLDCPLYHNGFYVWNVPDDFNNYVQPSIFFYEDDYSILEHPVIKITPDASSNISESSFEILNPGKFSCSSGLIPVVLQYIDADNDYVTSRNVYSFRISNGRISETNPVVINGTKMKYTKNIKPRKITLKVTYPLDTKIYDKIDNILIL